MHRRCAGPPASQGVSHGGGNQTTPQGGGRGSSNQTTPQGGGRGSSNPPLAGGGGGGSNNQAQTNPNRGSPYRAPPFQRWGSTNLQWVPAAATGSNLAAAAPTAVAPPAVAPPAVAPPLPPAVGSSNPTPAPAVLAVGSSNLTPAPAVTAVGSSIPTPAPSVLAVGSSNLTPGPAVTAVGSSNPIPALQGCKICGDPNHDKKNCPTRPCKMCGDSNHVKKNCLQVLCSRCHGTGHDITNCTTPAGAVCYICCDVGHYANACTSTVVGTRCKTCGGAGHGDLNNLKHNPKCANPPFVLVCTECGQPEHRARDCPRRTREYGGFRGFGVCQFCRQEGHKLSGCPLLQ